MGPYEIITIRGSLLQAVELLQSAGEERLKYGGKHAAARYLGAAHDLKTADAILLNEWIAINVDKVEREQAQDV